MSIKVEELLKTTFEQFYDEMARIVVIDKSLFPEKDEVDLLEIVDLIDFVFPDDRIKENLDDLLELKQITMTDKEKKDLIPLLERLIKFVRKIKTI